MPDAPAVEHLVSVDADVVVQLPIPTVSPHPVEVREARADARDAVGLRVVHDDEEAVRLDELLPLIFVEEGHEEVPGDLLSSPWHGELAAAPQLRDRDVVGLGVELLRDLPLAGALVRAHEGLAPL